MENIVKVITSNIAICIYEAAVLGGIICYFIRLKREKKRCVEVSALQKEKAREEKLDQALKNERYQGDMSKIYQNNIPYEVNFHEELAAADVSNEVIPVQIVEQSKLSTRKYMVHISQEIYIGRGQGNGLVLNDLSIAEKQCRIFKHGQGLYVECVNSTSPMIIRRKKRSMQVENVAVQLADGDTLEMGDTALHLHII